MPDARLRVSVYAPDRHVSYDGRTPDRTGIGGGVVARLRTARALAHRGHDVEVICNTRRAVRVEGVRYVPLADVRRIETDVLILNSSAGEPDLRPALDLEITARLRIVRVDGTPLPQGLGDVPYDFVYTPSNFIRRTARDEWRVVPQRLATFFHGVDGALLTAARSSRDPFRLLYAGHPDKGLDAAVGVLRILRREEPRFALDIFGGGGIYGQPDRPPPAESGLRYHGTVGQRRLHAALRAAEVTINLQARPEPFGLVVADAMAAGSVVLASAVGAFPEFVRHGYNGFLLDGGHMDPATWNTAAAIIREVAAAPALRGYIRRHARTSLMSWESVVHAWEQHWRWALGGSGRAALTWAPPCGECGGERVALADGYHCVACGAYDRELIVAAASTRIGPASGVLT